MTKITPPHVPLPLEDLTCQQVTDVISHYINGEMDAATTRSFEAHLHGCTDCTAFLNTYRGTMRAVRALRYEDVPDEMCNRVQQFLHEKIQRCPPPHP
jgi:anti-sigma factor RsiW